MTNKNNDVEDKSRLILIWFLFGLEVDLTLLRLR